MGNDYLSKGEYNVICDRCGKKLKSSKVSKEWTGLIVCGECLDERHPQDFVRGVRDDMKVPFARPLPPPTYYVDTVTYSTGGTLLAPSGYGPEDDWDNVNAIIVRLNSGSLSSATESQVLSGANFIAIEYSTGNWEILQYQNATQLTSTTYSLSKLLRARFGTESYMGAPTGARFIFIGQISESAFYWLRNNLSIYSELYSPWNIYGHQTSPDILINLTRRSQQPIANITNWMTPYANAPLDSTEEIYELDILDSNSDVVRTIRLNNTTSCIYTESQQVEDFGAVQSRISLTGYQLDPIFGRGTARDAIFRWIKTETGSISTSFISSIFAETWLIDPLTLSFSTTFNSSPIIYHRKMTASGGSVAVSGSAVALSSVQRVVATSTGAGSWTILSGVTTAKFEAIGGGGNGSTQASNMGGGGGGGAYSVTNSVALTPGNTVYYSVGAAATDSWIRYNTNSAPSSTTDGCLAKGGASASGGTHGNGGASGSCVGNTAYSGGNGADYGGGGGAAGVNGAGQNAGAIGAGGSGTGGGGSNGGSSTAGGNGPATNGNPGGAGGAGTGGTGGGTGGTGSVNNGGAGSSGGGGGGGYGDLATVSGNGGAGGSDSSLVGYGSGGGGGSCGYSIGVRTGGAGGAYGGGGGGSANGAAGGAGGTGIIIITYTRVK